MRPQRIASYALLLWTILTPLKQVQDLQLTEGHSLQAVSTARLDEIFGAPLVGNSGLSSTTSWEKIALATDMDDNIQVNTDKVTDIAQFLDVCFYRDKPLIPSWITEESLGPICTSSGLANVTFTATHSPRTFIPSPDPFQTTDFQPPSGFPAVLLLMRYLELDYGAPSGCVCKGDSGIDPRRMLFQMAINLLASSLTQRLYLYILKHLRGAMQGHTVYELSVMLFWRKNGDVTVIHDRCIPISVTSPPMARDDADTDATLGNLPETEGDNVRQTKTNDSNWPDQILSEPHPREPNMGRPSMNKPESQQKTSSANRSNRPTEHNTPEGVSGFVESPARIGCTLGSSNGISQNLCTAVTGICKNADLNVKSEATALYAPLSDDLSSDLDVCLMDQSGSVDAWFATNMSKEIPLIKETGNSFSTDNTDEHESGGQLVMDPAECKPIHRHYPRSEDTRPINIVEASTFQEAHDYVAERCPFLFEDLETPPLTPTLPDAEDLSSLDEVARLQLRVANDTITPYGSDNQLREKHCIVIKDMNTPTHVEDSIQLAPTGQLCSESNENSRIASTAVSNTARNISSEIDGAVLITPREHNLVPVQKEYHQEGMHIALPNAIIFSNDAGSTATSTQAIRSSKKAGRRKPSNREPRIKQVEDAIAFTSFQPVDIWSPTYLERELTHIDRLFETKGSPENWQIRDDLINHLRGMLKGYTFRSFSKELATALAKNRRLEKTLSALSSSRQITVCLVANYYSELAQNIGSDFEQFVKTVLPPLLRLSGSRHPALVNSTQMAIQNIIIHGIRNPRVALSFLLRDFSTETNSHIRRCTMRHLTTILKVYSNHTSLTQLRLSCSDVTAVTLSSALSDTDVEVRREARSCYWEFAEIWSKVALDIRKHMSKRAKELLDKSKLDRSISVLGLKVAVEIPNLVVTDIAGDDVEPFRPQVWKGNGSYPPEAFLGRAPLIDARYLAP